MSSEILVLLGSIGRSQSLADAIGLNCGIRKVREDKTLRSPLVAGAWRVFCYSCTSTLLSSRSILTWRVAERFYSKFFGFLFDNTSWCYLVFTSLFPTLLAFILLLMMDEYGLG